MQSHTRARQMTLRVMSWFQTTRKQSKSEPLSLSPGRVVYAIGDIHGRADLLHRLLEKVDDDIANSPENIDPLIVFLGDYIDRGDDSAATLSILERLWSGCMKHRYVFLKGNHEAAMLDFIDAPETSDGWLRFGGLQTLQSFGVRGIREHADVGARIDAARTLRAKLASQEMFLRLGLKLSVHVGNIFFCHAAIDIHRPLDDQKEKVLLWGKPSFPRSNGPDDAWVVHGHTISAEPDIGHNRIGIDTGAYYSGKLTAARISDGNLRFLST